eukprot:gnl/MRDRNA2_/MRDRNA2_90994_c0_seq1.p1 gnl/MRDRNA2_/MRDRNA2_90994_c0~~gnl/MRDRNA2_/MRDRNA2_90994_c0_seq1.p1  ORF type:complete len:242 (-),score=35.31 gnl/MRDRNA2_/MRDRNA2_90994_c0_seq1:34-759(-)
MSKSARQQAGEAMGPHSMDGVDPLDNTWSISPRPPPDGSANTKFSYDDMANKMRQQGGLQKSLGLRQDPRFKEIRSFRDQGQKGRKQIEPGKGFDEIVSTEKEKQTKYTPQDPHADDPSNILESRIAWQETFDSTVNRLMVDFSLSDEPTCRLNHLDRLYAWFTGHGKKQVRKARPSPNFLNLDKNEPAPKGSTRNVTAPLSQTSLVLSNTMNMRRSKRMPPAQNMYKASSPSKSERKYRR